MSDHKYTVEFRIYGDSLDPNSVTLTLGLQPCQLRASAETRRDGRSSSPMWAYRGTEQEEWRSLEDGIENLLPQLWPHRQTIAGYIKAGFSVLWWCGHFQSGFDGGPRFSADCLKRLGEFGAELYIDNYFVTEP